MDKRSMIKSDADFRAFLKGKKRGWQIVEFAYGFAVLYNGKRVGLCGTEERAEELVRLGKSERGG